jgi:hypothetical protein
VRDGKVRATPTDDAAATDATTESRGLDVDILGLLVGLVAKVRRRPTRRPRGAEHL